MTGLKLFKELFVGRTDAYGYGNMCIKQKLTDEAYKDHILGHDRIGIYPIIKGSLVKWCAVDIDENSFDKVLNVYNELKSLGLSPYLERSKSKGFHIWCWFDEWVDAVKPRLVTEMILSKFGYNFEIFPKQDKVEEGKFGNFIFLPLFGGSVIEDRTVFIDIENKVRISKMEDLSKIKLSKASILNEVIEKNELARIEYIATKEPYTANVTSHSELPCVEAMKKGVEAGHRNEVGFRLAIHMKESKLGKEECIVLMNDWNAKNNPPISNQELTAIITSVYKGQYKSYGCETPVIKNYCDKTTCPLVKAQDKQALALSGVIVLMFRNADTMVFKKNAYEYRLSNFEFTKGGKFKSSLTLSKDNAIVFKDVISLDRYAHRKRFIDAAKDEELDSDLIKIEELVKKQIDKEEKEKLLRPKQLYIMTEPEKKEAMEFLENTSDILYQVIHATDRMGIVGENILRVMVYLCFTSRITDQPLSITVKGESSSGKSFACQVVKKLIPEEGMFFITRATQNALYHIQEDGLQHKIVYINELPGSESADYSIRSAQSERDLVLMVPKKDPTTGSIETEIKVVKGPVGFLLTTTKAEMFDENETRNFSLYTDDSPSLTKEIGKITVRKAKGELFELSIEEINLFKNIQRLLNPDYRIVIPYAEEVFSSFPEKPVRIRRDRERFRVLIEIVTLLHQFHREHREEHGKVTLVSTLADYYIAKKVGEAMLLNTIYEIGPASKQVLETIKYLEDTQQQIDFTESFSFTYQDISDVLEWKYEKTKKWVKNLLHAGLIMFADDSSGGRGKTVKYKLIKKHNSNDNSFEASFLPKIEDLYEKYPCDIKLFYNPFTDETPEFLEEIRFKKELEKENV